jgi:RNA polymerase sigma factor (sigma-70 family)
MKITTPDAPGETADQALAQAAAGGDEHAFTALYERHQRTITCRIGRLIGRSSDCEDVTQQVFMQLFRALPRYLGNSSVRTFLHRIMLNVTYDYLRKRCRSRIDCDDDVVAAAIDGSPSPAQALDARRQLTSLSSCLDKLSVHQRMALMLVAIDGCSLNEAAARVGASPAIMKQVVAGARRELAVGCGRSGGRKATPVHHKGRATRQRERLSRPS